MKHFNYPFSMILALLFGMCILFSCSTVDQASVDSEIVKIIHGTSFGHCRGYCTKELSFAGSKAIFTKSSVDSTRFPLVSEEIAFSKEEWNKLLEKVDVDSFFALQERYGCPDCADGGSEYIEIITKNSTKRVTIEYGSSNDELGEFLLLLRQLRQDKIPTM